MSGRFGYTYGGATSPYVKAPTPVVSIPHAASQYQQDRTFPERSPGGGDVLMKVAGELSSLPGQAYERPVAAFNVAARAIMGTPQDKPGPFDGLIKFLGNLRPFGGVSPDDVAKIATGKPVVSKTSFAGDFDRLSKVMDFSGNIPGAVFNAGDASVLRKIHDQKLKGSDLIDSSDHQRVQSTKTVTDFYADLDNRGFFTAKDADGNDISQTPEDLIRKMDSAGALGAFQFGDKAISDNVLTDQALRMVFDPVNLAFFAAAPLKALALAKWGKAAIEGGEAAVRLAEAGPAAFTAATTRGWVNPVSHGLSMGEAAVKERRGVGYLDDMVQRGFRLAEYKSPTQAAISMAEGNTSAGTLKGLGLIFARAPKAILLPGKDSLFMRYTRGSIRQQAAWMAGDFIGSIGQEQDADGNIVQSGFLSPLHDLSETILNDRPLSGNQVFTLITAIGLPYGKMVKEVRAGVREGVDRATGSGRGVRWSRVFGDAPGSLLHPVKAGIAKEENMYERLGRTLVKDEKGRLGLSEVGDVALGKEEFGRLQDYIDLQQGYDRLATNPKWKIDGKSLDHVLHSGGTFLGILRNYTRELLESGVINDRTSLEAFQKWGRDFTTSHVGVDGEILSFTSKSGFDLTPEGLLDEWVRYSRANEHISSIAGPLTDTILGRVQNMTYEGIDLLIEAVVDSTKNGKVRVNWVKDILKEYPAMFTDPAIPMATREYFGQLMNEGVSSGLGAHGAGAGFYDAEELLGHLTKLRDSAAPKATEMFHEANAAEVAAPGDPQLGRGVLTSRGVNKLHTTKDVQAHQERSSGAFKATKRELDKAETTFAKSWTKTRPGGVGGNYKPPAHARVDAPKIMEHTMKEGGGSYDPVLREFDKTAVGYGVGAVDGTFAYIKPGDTEALADAVERVALTYPDNNIGTWLNDSMIEVDPSSVVQDFGQAMQLAEKNNQKAIRDLAHGTDIPNPKYKPRPIPPPVDAPGVNPAQGNPGLQELAQSYNEAAGLPGLRKGEYFKIDQDFSQRTAQAFESMPKVSKEAKPAYEAFAKETLDQWNALEAAGYKFEPWVATGDARTQVFQSAELAGRFKREMADRGATDIELKMHGADSKRGRKPWIEVKWKEPAQAQPYANSAEMAADVAKKHLYFFTGGEPHPYLGELAPVASGAPEWFIREARNPFKTKREAQAGAERVKMRGVDARVVKMPEGGWVIEETRLQVGTPYTYNDIFRAVHDVMTHAQEGFQFGPRGELNAAIKHSQMYTPLARKAMLSETHGQNSWTNFHEKAAVNKETPGTIYADQKAALLPREIINEFENRFISERPPEADLVALRDSQKTAVSEHRARLAQIQKTIKLLVDRSKEVGLEELHYTFRNSDGTLAVDRDSLERVLKLKMAVDKEFPALYELKKPPTPHVPWGAADSAVGAIYTQRTALGRVLFDYGPLSKFSRFMDYILSPQSSFGRSAAAHRMIYSVLEMHGAHESEVSTFLADMAEHAVAKGTMGPMHVRVARGLNNLTPSEIAYQAAKTWAPGTAVAKAIAKKYGEGNFYKVIDRASNNLAREGQQAMWQGAKGGDKVLSRIFAKGYSIYQDAPLLGGLSRGTRLVDKTIYPLIRFQLSPRWQAMNLLENDLIGIMQDGISVSRFRKFDPSVASDRLYELASARSQGRSMRKNLTEPDMAADIMLPDTGTIAGHWMEPVMRRQFEVGKERAVKEMLDELPEISPEIKWFVDHFGPDKRTWSTQIDDMLTSWETKGVHGTMKAETKLVEAQDKWTPQEKAEIAPFLTRLEELHTQLYDDIARFHVGDTSRSRLERLANSYWLYWPISYQIKTTKWMLDLMTNRAFGMQTNLGGAWLLEHGRQQIAKQMEQNPDFRNLVEGDDTMWMLMNMMFPAVPWDQGFSLSRLPRYLGGNVLHWWPEYPTIDSPLKAAQKAMELGPFYDVELGMRAASALFPDTSSTETTNKVFK